MDIERNFDTVTVADIECYENFVLQEVTPVDNPPTVQPPPVSRQHPITAARAICAPPYKYVYSPPLNLLVRSQSEHVMTASKRFVAAGTI